MIRIIHTNNEPVLSQKAVSCVPILLQTKNDTLKEQSLTSAVEATEEKNDQEFNEQPWLSFILELIQDLKDTAENIADNCLGLSANQIWKPENYNQKPGTPPPAVFIMRWPDAINIRKWGWKAIINPLIRPTGKTLKKIESCLSFPDKTKKVRRGKNVIMEWQPEDHYNVQTTHLREMQGPYSQIVQHEYDHLNGKHI